MFIRRGEDGKSIELVRRADQLVIAKWEADKQLFEDGNDIWVARVVQFMVALNDLRGQAQDEIDTSTPEDAVDWCQAQFMEIFGVH